MDLKRMARHLWYGPLQVKRCFPTRDLDEITRAIAETETRHQGEIRFVVESSLDWIPLLKGVTARQRAIEVFSDLRIWDTEANSGVLVYLLLADRDVEIIGDRGIHAKMGDAGWQAIMGKMERAFREGRFGPGVVEGIQDLGRHLEMHFPRQADNPNELSDRPVIL